MPQSVPKAQSGDSPATRIPVKTAGPSSGAPMRLPLRTANTRSSTRLNNQQQSQSPQKSSMILKPGYSASLRKGDLSTGSTSTKPAPKPANKPPPKSAPKPSQPTPSSSQQTLTAQQQPKAIQRPPMSAAEQTIHTELLTQMFSDPPHPSFLQQEPIRGVKKSRTLPRRNVAQDQSWENFERL